jgi:beta-phosphoglucomutase
VNTPRYGLIFDMDGVISDTESINAVAAIQTFRDLFGLEGVTREDFEGGIGKGAEAYMRAAAEVHGMHLSDEQVEQATAVRQNNILTILKDDPLPAFPGVLELMNGALTSPDWSVAIATGSTREKTEAVLTSAQVPYADMICITGSEIAAKKPAPDTFLVAAKEMNIEPALCVVIEDSISGVQAARAAGAKCIAVTNSFDAGRLAGADVIVDSVSDLSLNALKALLAG